MKASIIVATLVLSALLSACTSDGSLPDPDVAGANYEHVRVPPSKDPRSSARASFARGDYPSAARYYEQVLAGAPGDREATLGSAAALDEIGRFDLADRYYTAAASTMSSDPAYLNNRGYSYFLRGNLAEAGRYFDSASRLDPHNPQIRGNLALLRSAAAAYEDK
jgi:Flp pilus assembly protein TadD